MKTLLIALLLTQSAHASELVTLLGRPDDQVDFVHSMITDRIAISAGALEVEESTRVYSLFAREGVRSATSVEVIPENSAVDYAPLMSAIRLSWAHAPVVFDPLGPNPDWLCAEMARHPATVYVLPAGAEGSDVPPPGACRSSNLLYVAAMDVQESLAGFSNFGDWVHLAAPGVKIQVVGRDRQIVERSGTSWAAATVAGRLAVFARHSELKGATLRDEFLLRATHPNHELEGKVQAARALNPRSALPE